VIRILMVSSYPLLSQSIKRLLCDKIGLEIVGRETKALCTQCARGW
jgi:hypothetical protein